MIENNITILYTRKCAYVLLEMQRRTYNVAEMGCLFHLSDLLRVDKKGISE